MKVRCLRTVRGKSSKKIIFVSGCQYNFIPADEKHREKYAGYIEHDHQGNKRWLSKVFFNSTFEKEAWR